jgi:hypothetical protein
MTVLRRPATWDESKKQLGDPAFMSKLLVRRGRVAIREKLTAAGQPLCQATSRNISLCCLAAASALLSVLAGIQGRWQEKDQAYHGP